VSHWYEPDRQTLARHRITSRAAIKAIRDKEERSHGAIAGALAKLWAFLLGLRHP
jgi:hypothetical protein